MTVQIIVGDSRTELAQIADGSVDCCVSSPPYFNLRDYQVEGQIGIEATPEEYVAEMVALFREVRRTLTKTGTLWLNLADSYVSAPGQALRGGPPSKSSTLEGNGHRGGGPKLATLSRVGAQGNKQNRGADCVGRSHAPGLKPKDLIGIPWMVGFALRDDGWWLRSANIWAKPNGMPGSQDDRCTSSYETVFLLSKSEHYWSDFDAIKTPPRESTRVRLAQDVQAQAASHRANGGGKTNGTMKAVGSDKQRGHSRQHAGFNARWDAMEKAEQQAKPAMMRDVWFVSPGGYSDAHFAVMPEEIARRCILAGCPQGGVVLDPFGGAGTTGLVAARHGRSAILVELNPDYAAMAQRRIKGALGIVSGADEARGLEPLPLFR